MLPIPSTFFCFVALFTRHIYDSVSFLFENYLQMHWYYSAEAIELQTPSRIDGIDYETEARYRKEGARFIMELGNKLGLRYLTMATGIVFFHRFYMFHSFKEFSRWVNGATCLFLAGKVEETPKKCRDILKVAQQTLSDKHFKTFGENPREEIMIIERILLQTIKFDLQTSHPYQYLIKYGKLLKGEKIKINELVQRAWIFINDSLSTTLCLIYKPQVVAIAVLLLAVKMSNQNIRTFMTKPRADWWKVFHADATEADLEDICKEMMNMYEGKQPRRRFPTKQTKTTAKKSPSISTSPKAKKKKISVSESSVALPLTDAPLLQTKSVRDDEPEFQSSKPQPSLVHKPEDISEKNEPPLPTVTQSPVIRKTPPQTSVVATQQHSTMGVLPSMPQHPPPQPPMPTQPPVMQPQTQAPILDHMSSFFQSNQSYNFQPFPQPPPFTPVLPFTQSQTIPPPPLLQTFQPPGQFPGQPMDMFQANSYNYANPPQQTFAGQGRMPAHVAPPFQNAPWMTNTPPQSNNNPPPWIQ